jgi:hypothetical protein
LRLPFCAPARRLAGVAFVAALALLSACSSSPRNALSSTVGVATGVALASSTGTFLMQHAAKITITATIAPGGDPNGEGVTFQLTGQGTLSNQTKFTVDYTAPDGFAGISSPILLATGVHDTSQLGSITMEVDGTPIINPTSLFPGNLNTPFAAAVVVLGGLAPYTWTLNSGTLPTGITLGATTTQYAPITGTPTQTGTFNIQLKAVDANSAAATVDLVIQINAAESCLLSGQFAVLETGFIGNRMTVGAGGYTVTSAGVVSGYQDYGATTAVAEPVTGTCTTRVSNNGTLTTVGATRSPQYNYALAITLNHGRVQLMNGGDSSISAGALAKQDPTAFTPAALAGDWAFGAVGSYVPGATNVGQRVGMAGRFTLDGSGVVSAGLLDANTTTPATAAPFTGSAGPPDANGRGTLQFSAAGTAWNFHYYVVDASHLYIVATDPASGAPQLAGFATRQVGPFDSTSLGGQGIVSLFGASGQDPPHGVLALGRLSAASTTASTVTFNLDTADHGTPVVDKAFTGAAYAVAASGRATLSYTDGTATRSFTIYLDGADDGFVIEPAATNGTAGLLEAQMAGPFDPTVPGIFVSGSQFPQDPGPITLLPQVSISSGGFSSGSGTASGNIGLDVTTGRGIGLFGTAGSTQGVIVTYQVSPSQVRMLRFGAQLRSPVIEFLGD